MRFREKRSGFALVLALGVMSILVGLVLCLSYAFKVNLFNASQAKYRALARANAKVGMRMALAELQVYAGADCCLTGVAEDGRVCVWDGLGGVNFFGSDELVDLNIGASGKGRYGYRIIPSPEGLGVLSNAKEGGLKQNIRPYFEEGLGLNNTDLLFTTEDGGLYWGLLKSFYNLKNEIKNNTLQPRPYVLEAGDFEGDYRSALRHGVGPVVDGFTLNIEPYVQDNRVWFKYELQYSLWNPYTVTLAAHEYCLGVSSDRPRIVLDNLHGKEAIDLPLERITADGDRYMLIHQVRSSFGPGERKLFKHSLNKPAPIGTLAEGRKVSVLGDLNSVELQLGRRSSMGNLSMGLLDAGSSGIFQLAEDLPFKGMKAVVNALDQAKFVLQGKRKPLDHELQNLRAPSEVPESHWMLGGAASSGTSGVMRLEVDSAFEAPFTFGGPDNLMALQDGNFAPYGDFPGLTLGSCKSDYAHRLNDAIWDKYYLGPRDLEELDESMWARDKAGIHLFIKNPINVNAFSAIDWQDVLEGMDLLSQSESKSLARELEKSRPYRSVAEFINYGLNQAIQSAGLVHELNQREILGEIAHRLSVRSDTFIIRGYGEVLNPGTLEIEKKASCEALVQRLPTELAGSGGLRRFEIKRFRWME